MVKKLINTKWLRIAMLAGALGFGSYGVAAVAHTARTTESTPQEKIDKRLEHMKKKLSLTDAQVNQIKAIFQQDMPQMQKDREAIKAMPKGDQKKAAFVEFQKGREAQRQRIAAILTPEQRATFDKMKDKHREHGDEKDEKNEKK